MIASRVFLGKLKKILPHILETQTHLQTKMCKMCITMGASKMTLKYKRVYKRMKEYCNNFTTEVGIVDLEFALGLTPPTAL